MLFLLYIDDINHAITSKIKLFADDVAMYKNIRGQYDHLILHNNLDAISLWAEYWLMKLNNNKCVAHSI